MRREPERPKRVARATMLAIRAGASVDGWRTSCCGARAGPVTGPARRADTGDGLVREDVARRRWAGRRRFPLRRPAPARCPTPGRPPAACAGWSPARAPAAVWPDPPAARRPPGARATSASRRWPMISSAVSRLRAMPAPLVRPGSSHRIWTSSEGAGQTRFRSTRTRRRSRTAGGTCARTPTSS